MEDSGDSIKAENGNWTFSGDMCQSFDQHISKSVPFYHEGHDLILKISDFFLGRDTVCYELGCSTGVLTSQLAEKHASKNISLIAVDKEPDMIRQAEERCSKQANVSFVTSDLLDVKLEPSDLIISYYTMQFVKPQNRQIMFDRIYESLKWGGAFLLFEKVRGPDARFQDMMTSIYTDYKLDQGYSSDEIISKSRSLKGVLEPFSTQANCDLLKRAGFVDIMTVMKYVSFEGFLAIK